LGSSGTAKNGRRNENATTRESEDVGKISAFYITVFLSRIACPCHNMYPINFHPNP
jgi:hypothetical protein